MPGSIQSQLGLVRNQTPKGPWVAHLSTEIQSETHDGFLRTPLAQEHDHLPWKLLMWPPGLLPHAAEEPSVAADNWQTSCTLAQ